MNKKLFIMNKKLFIMNKKLLMGLGSALILSAPILVATSCGDNGVKVSGYQLLKDNTDATKIIIRINGQNLSTKSEDWQITDSNNSPVYNVWNFDFTKSNSNSVYFSATKDDTKGKTYTFSCNGTKMILNFSTPFAPTAISSTNGLKAFKGYQGTNQNPETSEQNKANISITDLTVNFEFKNVSQDSAQFMKLILPPQLGNVFENYQGYKPGFGIKWSLKDTNSSDFEITNNTLISTKPIDPTTVQNVTLVGSLNMNGWEDTFEIKVNFSNEAKDIQINSITSKIEQDKVVVTVTGSKLPTDFSNWKFKENDNTVSSEWLLSSSSPATETQVTFEAAYANVIGKTFTIEGTGTGSTASKEFTVPVSTISNINSEMTNEGDLKLTVSGTNLSSAKSLYVFTFVKAAASTYTNANPSIDVNKIDLTWTNSSQIVFTIVKQDSQGQPLTKGLYGSKFSLQIKGQTPATEFTFSDYVVPTAIIKDRFFTNVKEGASSDLSNANQVSLDKITGDNLSYTITTSSANNKFVSILLPTTNIFNFLSGQKGFTTSENNTTLTWSIPTDQTNNWEYDTSSSILKNKNALTTSGFTVVMIGTLKDTLTNVTKTFELSLTIKMDDNLVQTISNASSGITQNGDLTILLTGSNLSQEVTKYQFAYSGSETTNIPTVDSTILELDTNYHNTNTSVQFIIKKIKDTTSSDLSNYASPTSPTLPPLPIAQTKGLYGKTFSVTLVDAASNSSSRVEEQPVTFTFADYKAPTSIQSSKFFENADSSTQKENSLPKEGEGSSQQNFCPLTKEDISQPDASKPFEWTITSHYKSNTYIYLVLPSEEEILASIGGWKGFSENLPSSPESPQNTYTIVSWKFKDGTDHANFEELSDDSNVLRNKNALTDNTPISAELTATITDRLTNKSLSFNIKITFKLGTFETPTITNQNENATLSDNNTNVKVTITGTNLPKDIEKWKIEESKSNSSQQPNEAGDTSNSIWTINASTALSTSIEFSAKYSDVAGKKYNFSLVGYSGVTTTVTCPTPKFTFANSKVAGQFAHNKYDIEFTLSGENLPGDISMYKFGKVDVGGGQQVSLDDLQKTINFVNGTQVKITFNKYKDNEITDRTVQTKGLYGKEVSIWFSNETQSDNNKISFPNYYVNGMKKEFLGTISTGSDSSNLTPQTNLGIDIKTTSNNNEYQVTITTDSDTAKFIKFELPSHSIDSSETDVMGRADGSNFLETGFDSWGGFHSSILTSLTWSISTQSTQTPPSSNGSESSGGSREGNDGTSTETNGWKLDGNVLTNSSALTTQGSNVVLTATLTDSETGETVSLKVNLTVKLKTSSSKQVQVVE